MYELNILIAIKRMTIKKPRDFIYENYYRRIGFPETNRYYSINDQKKKDFFMLAAKLKMHDPSNTKEYYQSYLKRKNAKLGKATKNNYTATKNYQKLKYW